MPPARLRGSGTATRLYAGSGPARLPEDMVDAPLAAGNLIPVLQD
jgi:hypothetical protein